VTFTSSVSAGATGVVEFIEIAAPAIGSLGTVPLVNGVAALTVPSLSAGTHSIQAYYHGDATHDSKYSIVLNQGIINKPTATISLYSSMNPGIMGIQFDIAATVAAPAVPPGALRFRSVAGWEYAAGHGQPDQRPSPFSGFLQHYWHSPAHRHLRRRCKFRRRNFSAVQ
jgi:hypothetical protein